MATASTFLASNVRDDSRPSLYVRQVKPFTFRFDEFLNEAKENPKLEQKELTAPLFKQRKTMNDFKLARRQLHFAFK